LKYASGQTDKQTDRDHTLMAILRTTIGGEVTTLSYHVHYKVERTGVRVKTGRTSPCYGEHRCVVTVVVDKISSVLDLFVSSRGRWTYGGWQKRHKRHRQPLRR